MPVMTLTSGQSMAVILVIAAATLLTRALPFILFPARRKTPQFVTYLGRVLPFAITGMLVVYCLKNTRVMAFPYGLPEFISIAVVVAVHLWKRNTLLSIGTGTVIYMVMVQLVFL